MKIDMLHARFVAAPVAAIAISAWLGVSNHCALTAFGTGCQPVAGYRQDAHATTCPFHSHSSKPALPKQSDAPPCCKILRAIPPAGVKSHTPAVVHLARVNSEFAEGIVFPPSTSSADPHALDTGPPGALSFAELILQRSMPALAPPIPA